jgi:hypothetical protein
MTTYNEAQTFCEIEKFIKDVVDGQINCEQFKQQIVPLIIKSRRFFIAGYDYVDSIIIFKLVERALFQANKFRFFENIKELPDHVIELMIADIQSKSELIQHGHQYDQKQNKAETKKVERFLLDTMQYTDCLMIFPMRFSIKEGVSSLGFNGFECYVNAILREVRAREISVFHCIHSVIWKIKHHPEQGYYLQIYFIYAGQAQDTILSDHANKLIAKCEELSNGFGEVYIEEQAKKGWSVNCQDDRQIQRNLQLLKSDFNANSKNHYLRVMLTRGKTFNCECIPLKLK